LDRPGPLTLRTPGIRSEIYRYRTRVGQYRRRAANEALDRLLSSQQIAGDARKSTSSSNAKATTSRQAFSANLQEVSRRPPPPHYPLTILYKSVANLERAHQSSTIFHNLLLPTQVRSALTGEEKLAALNQPEPREVKKLKGLFKSELQDVTLPRKIQRLQGLVKLTRAQYEINPGRATKAYKVRKTQPRPRS
jgi:hypothetical protein